MKNKYHCNPVNKYLDISKLDLEKWKRAGALLGLGLDGNLTLLEKPNYTDEGNGKEALFDDGKYRKVYTIDEVDKLLKDLNISGDASIKEVSDALSKFQSSQEAINTELHNKDVAQDKRMDELVKDISTNTANIKGTDSKVETNKVDIQYIKDNYLNKDNVNTLASKEEVKAVKDITEVNRGLIDSNRKDINSLLEGEDSYTHFRGLFDTIDNLKIVTFPKVNDFAYVEETHTKWQFTVDHKWVDTKYTYPRDTRNASKEEFDNSVKESNEALEKAVNELNENKVDKTVYEEDLASLEEYKESQSELNAKQDIDINKNLQNINQLNDMIKVLSQKDEPIMSANGGGVISLPNNAMKSVAPRYKFEGLTLNQLVENGDFSKGTNRWNSYNLSAKVEDGFLILTPSSGYQDKGYSRQAIYAQSNGDIAYIKVIAPDIDNPDLYIRTNNDFDRHPISGTISSARYSLDRVIDGKTYIGLGILNTEDLTTERKIKSISYYNLTQTFGAGNEPTKEWCDEHIQGYFEGVKSVQTPMRVRSESGRVNYLPLSNVDTFGIKKDKKTTNSNETKSGKIVALTNIENTKDGNYNLFWKFKNELPTYKKGTKFQLSFLIRVDKDCEIGRSFNGLIVPNITPSKLKANELTKVVFDCVINVENAEHYNSHLNLTPQPTKLEYGDMKLEIGDSPTEWIPHISESSLSKGNMMYINNQLELKSVGTAKDYIEDGKLYKNVSDDGEILENQEVINLDTSGLITTHPNGTIFIESITNITAYYNDGLDVSNFNIESVEEFAIFKDGNYQNLDVSKIEIADNKLTHPDAINGLCYLVFRYDNTPIFGDNEVEYYNNDCILVSPDGTFWKPVLTVDDEGNILMKGEKL